MDVLPTIPLPQVPVPQVNAPAVARDPRGFEPPSRPVPDDPFLMTAIDRIPDGLPGFAAEALFSAVKAAHRLYSWKDPKPNGPLPKQEGSWTFGAIGDYGSGRRPLTDVSDNILKSKPDLLVTLGDNVYYGGTEEEFAKKWDPPNMFGRVREQIPVMPSLGNHDLEKEKKGDPYFRRFPELDRARFYSFDQKNVHFVSINTNESLDKGSPQLQWLEQDLAANKADWQVVYFHHPLMPNYPMSGSGNQDNLGPLLAKHGVDLVLSGHAHNYSRSKPLNEQGTIEVITGGGGQSLHPFTPNMPNHLAYRDIDFGHVEVEVQDKQLVGRYVVRDGSVRDTFVVNPVAPAQATAGAEAVQQPATAEAVPA